ncbi:hypothetical protein Tco_0360001 [Tanacetum coccineum]
MRTRSQAHISVPEPPVRQPSVESSNLEKPDNPPIVVLWRNARSTHRGLLRMRPMRPISNKANSALSTFDGLKFKFRPPVPPSDPHAKYSSTPGVSKTDFERYVTANDAVLRNMQNQGQNLQSQMANLTDMLSKFVTANTASISGSGTLPGNTVTNPKEDLKGITTRSGVTIQGPKAVNHDAEVTKDTMPPANNGSTEDVQPPVVQIQSRIQILEPIGHPQQVTKETWRPWPIQDFLGFSNVIASGNPTPYFEPIVSTASPNLTPFGDSDFLLFEEADSFLALEDDPTSSEVDPTYQDPEGDILLLEAILNSEPPPPLPNHEQYMPGGRKELKLCEAKTVEPSINEPPEVELKELPPHLEYAFLEGDNKLPVIIAKDLKDEEKAALLKRRVNPKIHDVIKKEVEKLLDAGLIYPISDSPWVSPVHCVPKKGGMTVITNDENELIPTRLVTGWDKCLITHIFYL